MPLYKIGLGVDYIGPSINWAISAKVDNNDILNYIKVSRTIGGHMLFPRWIRKESNGDFHNNLSINEAKGGKNSFYDRIDLTLLDICEWYNNRHSKLKLTYDMNKIWLDQFVDFKGFIEYFKLTDFIDMDESKVYIKDLTTFNSNEKPYEYLKSSNATIPTKIQKYMIYADGLNYLIKLRNNKLKLF